MKQVSSYAKGSGVVALAASASATFSGMNGQSIRKQNVIRNRSGGAGTLQIKDGNGNLMDELVAGDPPWTLETNALITIAANGGAVNYSVGEIFYA